MIRDCVCFSPFLDEIAAISGFDKGTAGKISAKEYASPFRLRIQAFDLIYRHDLDLWLPVAKSDCAGDADSFPLDHGKSLIGCYRRPGCDECGERLVGVFSSEINERGPSGLVVPDTTRPRTSTPLPTYLMASESAFMKSG